LAGLVSENSVESVSPAHLCSGPSCGASYTHFVRPDGGDANQCNGTKNLPYPGQGSNQNCAWKSLTYALSIKQTPRVSAGDKIYVESGTYKIGYGQPGAETNLSVCTEGATYDCMMSAVPSGVTIEGNCSDLPKLLGVERLSAVLDLRGSSNVTLKCLEITDNAECIEFHNTIAGPKMLCVRDIFPHGEWASAGITAADSENVFLDHVNVHGLAHTGISAGRIQDWTIKNTNIDSNGWVGWNGDIGADSSNSGFIRFLKSSIQWNGCVEMKDGSHQGCWAQQAGGYGDGIGTAATGGSWIFESSVVAYNTSDGIDLLYVKNAGGNVTVKDSKVGHNAGNQIKTRQNAVIENNVIIGDCAFHENYPSMDSVDLCRAAGNTLSLSLSADETILLKNNTITGEGDCLILTDGSGHLSVSGNIFDGRTDWRSQASGAPELTCYHYHMGGVLEKKTETNLIYNVKEGCQAGQLCADPKFTNSIFELFNPLLQPASPAVGLGVITMAIY
jgi:hypothetical protein